VNATIDLIANAAEIKGWGWGLTNGTPGMLGLAIASMIVIVSGVFYLEKFLHDGSIF